MSKEIVTKNKELIFSILLFGIIVLILSPLVSATGITLFCLTYGQTIYFSQCNPTMNDFTCTGTTCQVCVNEVSSGVFCTSNSCNQACVPYEEPVTQDNMPEITLSSPSENALLTNLTEISFKFSASWSSKISSCDLMIDNSNVSSTPSPFYSGPHTLFYSPGVGAHNWKIRCSIKSSTQVVYSSQRALTIFDPNAPEDDAGNESNETGNGNETGEEESEVSNPYFVLTSPANNFQSTGAQNIEFSFYLTENLSLQSLDECNLAVSSAIYPLNLTEAVDSSFALSIPVSPGSYNWFVQCANSTANLSSDTRIFVINSPSPAGGGSGGGGGGGSGSKAVNSSSKLTTNSTISGIFEASNTEENETVESTENSPRGFAGITGAAIGDALKKPIVPIVIVIVVLVIVGVLVYLKRR